MPAGWINSAACPPRPTACAGRPDAAAWVRRLREAALKDEQGIALDEAAANREFLPGRKGAGMTGRYRDNPDAAPGPGARCRGASRCLHDPEVFALEMERLFANTWVYVGHDSQVPNAGDYFTHHHRLAARADGAA